jgi:hypothetical protein
MFVSLLQQLWSDECGAVLSTEYIMLGSIVAAGGSTGMVALRDSMTEECKDFGASVREIRQSHMPKVGKPGGQQGQTPQTDASTQLPYWATAPAAGAPVCVNCTTAAMTP